MDQVYQTDLFLLDRVVQPVIDWLGRKFGVDFVKLGLIFGVLGIITDLVSVIYSFYGDKLVLPVMLTIWVIIDIGWSLSFGGAAIIAKRSVHKNIANPNRYSQVFTRLLCLVSIIAFFTFSPLISIFWLFLTIAWYILSCQAPPPKEKREPFWSRWLVMQPA